ncbi:ABC transporter permease [Variovorax sp. OV329]|uniref:ABC transporter permease n=1 Tax=Variovorax sp. OV329 TaxID=1882825 RepID=UPI0008E13751|nr:ABC transporter permease [Variovorax sp. OV329]SFM97794.1 NitT/TauT family transport system permease protein [Variovorax sp. OV329]
MRLINRRPGRGNAVFLLLMPFLLLIAVYFMGSTARLSDNPDDKLLPSATQMVEAVHQYAFTEDRRTGEYLLWVDTAASLKRLGIGLVISAATALVLGILLGSIPLFAASFSPFIAVLSMIPPLAVLPILFIVFGLDELSKVVLIVIGITPVMVRDLQQRAGEIPREVWVKAQTLGANSWTLILRMVLPQLMPRLLVAMRLSLGAAWLFLIAAEAIASTDGLGYRIFLVRRYLAMDVILPYVVWITLLAWAMDLALDQLTKRAFPWFGGVRHA